MRKWMAVGGIGALMLTLWAVLADARGGRGRGVEQDRRDIARDFRDVTHDIQTGQTKDARNDLRDLAYDVRDPDRDRQDRDHHR